jgi:hypothetical protein
MTSATEKQALSAEANGFVPIATGVPLRIPAVEFLY